MMARLAAACVLIASIGWAGSAAADDCRKVDLDAQHRSAPIGVQPTIKNLGDGEVYISLASAPVKDLSADPNDLYRLTGFVLAPGEGVGLGTTHMVMSVDNSPYVVQLVKHEVTATATLRTPEPEPMGRAVRAPPGSRPNFPPGRRRRRDGALRQALVAAEMRILSAQAWVGSRPRRPGARLGAFPLPRRLWRLYSSATAEGSTRHKEIVK
jgi:hypothetical protein